MVRLWISFCLILASSCTLYANASDPWWNANWHYRAEININSAVVNQTGKIDIDFNGGLGLVGDLDENSIRIVKSDGVTLLTKQEFTDILYSNATDGTNNGRGEVKFIIEGAGTVRYYVYYDITANCTKTALANAVSINGNFEHSTGTVPTGWTTGQANIGSSAPNNEVHPDGGEGAIVSVVDTGGTGQTRNTNNTAHTGTYFHIHGYRDRPESGGNAEQVWIQKTFTVPTSSAGNMTYWLRTQGWDAATYDNIRVQINGTTINQNNLNISNAAISVNTARYGASSGYTIYQDSGWTQASLNLSTYTGQTITVRIMLQTATDNGWKFWELIDDMEWSIKTATFGSQESLPNLSVNKSSCVINDPVNGTSNPKRIPGATIRYAFLVTNTGTTNGQNVFVNDNINSNFDISTIQNLQIQNGTCNCLGVASASNNGPSGTANGVNPIILDFSTVNAGATECGYFEVDIK